MVPVSDQTSATIVGTVVQLAVAVFVTVLIAGLAASLERRAYLRLWLGAWVALLLALIAIAVRHDLIPWLTTGATSSSSPSALSLGLHLIYQTGKMIFLALLGLGAWRYARGSLGGRSVAIGVTLAVTVGLITGWDHDLNRLVMWQGFVAVPLFVGTVGVVGGRRAQIGGFGPVVLIVALGALAVLWLLYIPAFGFLRGGENRLLDVLAGYNAYFDAIMASALGFGMVVAVMEDVNVVAERARKNQLDAVERSEGRLADVLAAAHEGIVALDGQRRIVALNPAAEQVFGVNADVVGTRFDALLRPDQRNDLWEGLVVATRRSEAHPPVALRREVTGRRSDGSEFPLELAVTSLGTGRGYVIIARDLTEHQREQAERERLHHQVAQAARLEAVGRMVSGVAHELNNPLTAILAFAQDLQGATQSDEDREALTVIVQQAQRCRVIVGDLLIFSRSRRDERRRIEPNDMVRRVLRVFERDSVRDGVQLEVDLPEGLPPIEVDTVGIEQVLTNLLTNALQAAPRGGLVSLTVVPCADRLEFVVEDDGPGISAEALPRLFEPFFTTKRPGEGTGLGLSVSHSIALQHDGSLEAGNRSDGGTGARFVLRLPFVDRRALTRDAPAGPAAIPDVTDPGRKPRRVLIVDDEDAIRSAMRRALERRGWSVDEATDGNEALLRIDVGGRPADYAAIVTDLRMPGLSGIELYHRLARLYPHLAERTVIVTGDTASPTVAEFLESIDRPCIQKPFDLRALAEILEQVVTPSESG